MGVLRTIACDVPNCGAVAQEPSTGAGWVGWGSVQGVQLNGVDNPSLCPSCLAKVMAIIDGGLKNGVD